MILVDEKIFCCHGGLSPDLQSMEQIRRIMRPTDVPDTGTLKGGDIPPPPTTEFVLPPFGLDFLFLFIFCISCHPPLTTNFLFSKFPMLWFYRFPVLKFWKNHEK